MNNLKNNLKSLKKTANPFHFYARLGLTLATGDSVSDAEGLLETIKTCPDAVLYAHTHRFLQEHQFVDPGPSNDFSVWAAHALGDEELAEKLGVIEPLGYSSLEDLRRDIVKVLSAHLKSQTEHRTASLGRELHILSSVRFSIPTGKSAADLKEFFEAIERASPATIYLHCFESRLRSAHGVSDFSAWLEGELGESGLAREIGAMNPHSQPLAEIKQTILRLIQNRLRELDHASA